MKKRCYSFLLTLTLILSIVMVPSMGAHAATVGVYAAVSPDPSYQVFYISSDDWANTRYDLYDGTNWQYGLVPSGSELRLSPTVDYDIYVYQVDGEGNPVTDDAYARSMLAHSYSVNYKLYDTAGNLIKTTTEETGSIGMGDSFVFQADGVIVEDGREYELSSSYTQLVVEYGTGSYAFEYREYSPEPETAYIYYVDDRGNVLKRNDVVLNYYGGDSVFNVESSIEIDGRKYTKLNGPEKITLNYFSPVLDYDIVYVEDAPAVAYPYSIKINYIDRATGSIIGNTYETITADDSQYDNIQILAPDSLEITSGGDVLYYHCNDVTVNHTPDGTVRSYDVYYDLFDSASPYTWTIKLVDSVSGALLGQEQIQIGVDETVRYVPQVTVSSGSSNYILDSSMATSYERNYSDTSSRILYIYYNEEGSVVEGTQTINITFRNVSDNTVLYTETATVAAGENYNLDTPESYTVNGKEFVRLAGQSDSIEHNYYSPQRSYTVYYRDINDLQNVDTVVNVEEVIYYDNPVEQIVYNDVPVEDIEYVDVVVPADQGITVITNQNTGDVTTLDDEQTPLAPRVPQTNDNADETTGSTPETAPQSDAQAGETTVLDDEDVPLANGPVDTAAVTSNGISGWVIALIVLVIIAAGIVAVYIIRKRKSTMH